jgi:hypothetical protein
MGAIIGRLGRTSVGGTQYRALQTKLARIVAEESETVYTLKDLLLEEVKEALSTNLEA